MNQAGKERRWALLSLLLLGMWFSLLVMYRQGPLIRKVVSVRDTVFGLQKENHGVKQVILLTQMRSGSSFTGHLLMAASSTFYTEEPVREFLGAEPTTLDETAAAIALLRDISLCRFSARPDYYERRLLGTHHHNPDTVRLCYDSNQVCRDPATNEALCLAARVRLTRVVSLDLAALTPLLRDPDLTLYIIHLVRDPRGTLASRQDLRKYFDEKARNMSAVCSRYRRDLHTADVFKASHPDRYIFLRYEDLSLHTSQNLLRLYRTLDLPYTAVVSAAVARHTLGYSGNTNNSYGTFRNSSATVFQWRKRLSFAEVTRVQQECQDVMLSYGYRIFTSHQEYQDPGVQVLLTNTS
ncbi:carbohydrate sulfotransferase 1-like [Panulirus ornatus]|uniref:carbohydrate sulfotransferase 1-like n=1 Tax=Panulirus ornatus TaxID=150431 RepID=UPI003A85B60D